MSAAKKPADAGNVALLVVPTEGGIVRGFTDPAAADAHARITGGFVTRTPVVADHREKASSPPPWT